MKNVTDYIILYLKKNFKLKKIDRKTVIVNSGLNLDSIALVKLITDIEKKTKKKFLNKFFYKLPNISIENFSKLFK